MGGGVSRSNDNYVLKCIPEIGDGSTGLVSINVDPTSTKKLKRANSLSQIEPLLKSKKETADNLESSAQSPKLIRGNSIIKSSTKTPPTAKQSNTSKTIYSENYPWLIKSTRFSAASLSDFEFGRIIGRGLMGTVRIVKYRGDKICVFKCVSKAYILKHNDQRHIQSEKEVLQAVAKCSFCVKLFGTFQDRHNLYFALEYACGGELFHRLGRKKYFRPDTAKFYVSEVFVALEHVQSLGFVYRDLKPENIILDEEGHCKLVDFGFSTSTVGSRGGMLHTLCGTPAYLAPEILDGKFTNGYTEIVDWWSFGILVYELLSGKTPFSKGNRESPYEIFIRILQNRIWFPIGFDSVAKDIVSRLTLPQISKRLCKSEEIKIHPYFTMPWAAVANRRLVAPFVPNIKELGDSHYFSNYGSSGVGDKPNLLLGDPNTEPAAPDTADAKGDFSGF